MLYVDYCCKLTLKSSKFISLAKMDFEIVDFWPEINWCWGIASTALYMLCMH